MEAFISPIIFVAIGYLGALLVREIKKEFPNILPVEDSKIAQALKEEIDSVRSSLESFVDKLRETIDHHHEQAQIKFDKADALEAEGMNHLAIAKQAGEVSDHLDAIRNEKPEVAATCLVVGADRRLSVTRLAGPEPVTIAAVSSPSAAA